MCLGTSWGRTDQPAGNFHQKIGERKSDEVLPLFPPNPHVPALRSTLRVSKMKRQNANSSGAAGGEKRNRHSSRTTVLSKAFRVVDAETRQEVRNKRIQQLEADNYGDADVDGQSALAGQDDEAYQDNSDEEESNQKKKKKKMKQQKVLPLGAGGSTKRSTRKVRSLERIIMEQGYQYHLQPPISMGKKSTEKKRSSTSSAATTIITIKDEDEEGGDDDVMGTEENRYMDVDDDEDYGSSSISSNKRNKHGMKSIGKIGSLSSSQSRGSSSTYLVHEEEEVEIVDSPFVYPNTLSIAGKHAHTYTHIAP